MMASIAEQKRFLNQINVVSTNKLFELKILLKDLISNGNATENDKLFLDRVEQELSSRIENH